MDVWFWEGTEKVTVFTFKLSGENKALSSRQSQPENAPGYEMGEM